VQSGAGFAQQINRAGRLLPLGNAQAPLHRFGDLLVVFDMTVFASGLFNLA